jgi:hypothetical protein
MDTVRGDDTVRVPNLCESFDEDALFEHLTKRRNRLMALLRKSIELDEPLYVSG